MTEWDKIKKVGQELQAYWLDMHRKAREGLPEKLAAQRQRLDEMDPFGAAIRRFDEGDKRAVAEYLSDHQLTDENRAQLATYALEMMLDAAKPKSGRPKGNALGAAKIAKRFYREWREWNKRRGFSDHGHGEKMKEEAVRFICDVFLSRIYGVSGQQQHELVLQNMKRPSHRLT